MNTTRKQALAEIFGWLQSGALTNFPLMKISWQRLRRMTKNDEENEARGCPFWKELRDLGPCVNRSGQ